MNGTVTEGTEVCGIAEFICANGVNAVTVQLKPWLVVSVPFVAVTATAYVPTLAFVTTPKINPEALLMPNPGGRFVAL